MFDLINGLPIHPLVVHAVVVLLPLAVVGTIAIAVVPRWRSRFGVLLVGIAAVATALIPVATSSGEALEKHVGDPGKHAELGDQLIFFAIPLLVLVAALVFLDHRANRLAPAATGTGTTGTTTLENRKPSALVSVVAVVAVLVALLNAVWVYRIGDSGARAAWGDQVSSSSR